MTRYRVHRLKDHLKESFRFAPHVSGTASVKPRDYKDTEEYVEAESPYAAFFAMKDAAEPLELGDVLETDGVLHIFKFVGFEAAAWVDPNTAAQPAAAAPKVPQSETASESSPGREASALQ